MKAEREKKSNKFCMISWYSNNSHLFEWKNYLQKFFLRFLRDLCGGVGTPRVFTTNSLFECPNFYKKNHFSPSIFSYQRKMRRETFFFCGWKIGEKCLADIETEMAHAKSVHMEITHNCVPSKRKIFCWKKKSNNFPS